MKKQDPVRNREVVPAPSHNNHRGDPQFLIQRAHLEDECGDGLLLCSHKLSHLFISDHKVGRTGVLIHQETRDPRLQGLHDVRSLAGRSTCILRSESGAVFFEREVLNERRDVHSLHKSSVFCPDLLGALRDANKFTAVSRHFVVASHLQCLQERRLSMKPPSTDQRDAPTDAHARQSAAVGDLHLHSQRGGGLESDQWSALRPRFFCVHRQIVNPRCPGQHRTVSNEGDKPEGVQLGPQILLVLNRVDVFSEGLPVEALRKQSSLHHTGQTVNKSCLRPAPLNRPASPGKGNQTPDLNELRRYDHSASGENVLRRFVNRYVSAL
mmetsp:Transcript_30014/g.58912  ORF Transcript_30014/g.58912 Transcript_30014/m.58912 type:complete len:325 (-) Transcript_30014:64-1038(-)